MKSTRYAAWLTEAGWTIKAQKPGRIEGKYAADIIVSRPDKRRRDLDGLLKPLLDCLVSNGVTDDDHLAQDIRIRWVEYGEGVRVTLSQWSDGQ